MINLGMENISKVYLGATEVPKLYFGSELVYTSEAPLDLAEPLTFEILSGSGQIRWLAGTSDYGKLEEVNYQKINEWGDIIEDGSIDDSNRLYVDGGQTVRFYGMYQFSNPMVTSATSRPCGRFVIDHGDVSFNVKGNIMSLLKYDWDDVEQVPVPTYSGMTDFVLDPDNYPTPIGGVFRYLFSGCTGLIDASQLILPATSLTYNCYYGMFQGCTSLTTAPELPATRHPSGTGQTYTYMFDGCSSLNYVKCLLTNYLAQGNWLRGVSATGTFVKHPDATRWPRNANGIPSGWTVVDA